MQLADYRVEIIPDCEFRLDGGAMFGVVPRVVWERVCPADELNRIRMNMNCLFVETPTEKIIIETGIGEKWSPRETEMYGINREKPFAQSLFEITGYKAEDITIVVNTHLHFDHAGGNTTGPQASRLPATNSSGFVRGRRQPNAVSGVASETLAVQSKPQFPNARYLVSKTEFNHAENPHERDRASYLPENWRPMIESGQLELMPDSYEIVDGLKIEQVRGHSETMQTVRLDRGRQTLYGFADLIPTRHHIKPAWIAGFDLYPVETLEFKKRILPQALNENWICLFYHDLEMPLCRLAEVNGKIVACQLSN